MSNTSMSLMAVAVFALGTLSTAPVGAHGRTCTSAEMSRGGCYGTDSKGGKRWGSCVSHSLGRGKGYVYKCHDRWSDALK